MKVIYGDDFDGAKERFLDLIERSRKTTTGVEWYQAKDLDLPRITELLTGTDLFGQKKTVFLEMLSGNFKGKKSDEIRALLKNENTDTLTVLEDKFDSKFYGGIDVQKLEIKLPALIFDYLDSLGRDSGIVLKSYIAVTQNEPAEKVFRMTVLRLQDLMRMKSNPRNFDLSKYYWKKIYQQAEKMPLQQIVGLYGELYKIDKETKNGVSPVDLSSRFELFWQLYRL